MTAERSLTPIRRRICRMPRRRSPSCSILKLSSMPRILAGAIRRSLFSSAINNRKFRRPFPRSEPGSVRMLRSPVRALAANRSLDTKRLRGAAPRCSPSRLLRSPKGFWKSDSIIQETAVTSSEAAAVLFVLIHVVLASRGKSLSLESFSMAIKSNTIPESRPLVFARVLGTGDRMMGEFFQNGPQLGNQYREDRSLQWMLRRYLSAEVLADVDLDLDRLGERSGR